MVKKNSMKCSKCGIEAEILTGRTKETAKCNECIRAERYDTLTLIYVALGIVFAIFSIFTIEYFFPGTVEEWIYRNMVV